MNRILIKILIVIWLIIAVGFTALLVYGIAYNKGTGDIFSSFKYGVEYSLTVQKDENIDLISLNKINLDFSSSEIVVQTTDEPNMRIVQKSARNLTDDEKFTVIKQDNEVTIKTNNLQKHFTIFNFGSSEQKIEVYIPKNYNKDLYIQSSSGNIEFNSDINLDSLSCIARSGNLVVENTINAKDINLKASSGNIDVESLISKTYKINTDSGNIKINSLVGSGELQASSGNIRVNYKDISEYSNVSAHSGNVNLVIPEGLSFEFNGKCTSGDIKSSFDLNYKNKKGNEATAQIGSALIKS
ncbi:DUF4097 family beta strand repeat-containing protein [Clostridium uliginosum]|uniref:Lia operon protein LiaG n=1 Tax=Clostridium uliginosum TaxID=119641 RepID=A0A1I1Q4N5_9CLOT|nr:DUF4097 family beta strand repeat-containing protein [Clostridium uliginosum]SFD16957.1 lia operon protein LiaG [Clostridium uliginosum]